MFKSIILLTILAINPQEERDGMALRSMEARRLDSYFSADVRIVPINIDEQKMFNITERFA